MCLIAFHFNPTRDPWLILAANRDEFHARPTRPMAWWNGPRGLLAGRDEKAGGTWLALVRDGRWAAVTNFRDPQAGPGARSRGELPVGFLTADQSPADYVREIYLEREAFGPFNLLAGTRDSLWYCSSRTAAQAVSPGIHALSNGMLDEDWPKSRRMSLALRGLVEPAGTLDPDRLFGLMNDRQQAVDEELPETGVSLEVERMLSAPFIVSPSYGTRCSTVLALGEVSMAAERRFDPGGKPVGEVCYSLIR